AAADLALVNVERVLLSAAGERMRRRLVAGDGPDLRLRHAQAHEAADGPPEALPFPGGERLGAPQRMDSRQEEGLGAVDVAHTGQDALAEERIPDRPARPLLESRSRAMRVEVTAQRIGSQPVEDLPASKLRNQLARRRPDQVRCDFPRRQPHAHGRPRLRQPAAMPVEPARHPEVDVDDEPAAPVMEEMLAVRLRRQESPPLQLPRFPGDPPLRRAAPAPLPSEVAVMDPREAMNRVAFGHDTSLSAE